MANEIFIIQLEFTYRALSLNTENITQEESLVFPEPGGNCMNWMLGHILEHRNKLLALINQEPLWNKETVTCYKRGADAAAEKENFLQWQQLLNYLNLTQELLLKTLKEKEISEADKIKSFAQLLSHEAYHAGQTGLLRRVLGKEGKIK